MVLLITHYSYSVSWAMYHVDFDWLGAMIKSVVYATTGILIKKFSQVRSIRPVICILLVVYDGSMWEPVLITLYLIVYVFLSVFVLIAYILRVERKFAKMSLSANRSDVLHDSRYMLFVMGWL